MSGDTSEKTLGIDLGTTNSGMAILENDEPQMLQNNEGDDLTPSVVSFGDDGSVDVGKRANSLAAERPGRTKREIKLEMGNEDYEFVVDGTEHSPVDISAEILGKIKRDAEDYLRASVSDVVITVPAYFSSDQKRNTKRAGEEAGFDSVELTNEPTAAALAYGEKQGQEIDGTTLVFDFGGGTLDVSIIEIETDRDVPEYEVKVAEGNNELGGRDFDRAIMEHLAGELDVDGADPLDDPEIEENLRKAAEDAKIDLSTNEETEVVKSYLGIVDGEPIDIDTTLTRGTFEGLIADELDAVRDEITKAMDDADVGAEDLDMVLLVGGSTYVPAVRDAVEEETGVEPERSRDPDQVVAEGAAVYGEKVNIEAGGQEGGDIEGKPGDIDVIEVIPASLGTRLHDGSFDPIIEGNTNLGNAHGTEYYSTVEDNQTVVTIDVYQGEDPVAENNTKLADFRLTGIPPMPAGKPQIEVTFYVDEDGILQVEADELTSDAEIEGEVTEDITGTKDEA
ncbi:Hsp70 family protein [Halobellus ruber]|uniref:Hsp70 family protein n=1 Tax=Halobellus ruber TaxID=2761102 RepID=A0A7J9SLF2_9EURY|nr:Hsp70 family protein [Halobellus ruber]MBB6647352.1 Hsp70 family protein [Halobellus ruber]